MVGFSVNVKEQVQQKPPKIQREIDPYSRKNEKYERERESASEAVKKDNWLTPIYRIFIAVSIYIYIYKLGRGSTEIDLLRLSIPLPSFSVVPFPSPFPPFLVSHFLAGGGVGVWNRGGEVLGGNLSFHTVSSLFLFLWKFVRWGN